jgi:hypothetical protein
LVQLPRGSIICHGDARGADREAGYEARRLGLEVVVFPANWSRYGKAAGPIRNQQMLDEFKPDLVLAFPILTSVGTYDMIMKATRAGVPVEIIEAVVK